MQFISYLKINLSKIVQHRFNNPQKRLRFHHWCQKWDPFPNIEKDTTCNNIPQTELHQGFQRYLTVEKYFLIKFIVVD